MIKSCLLSGLIQRVKDPPADATLEGPPTGRKDSTEDRLSGQQGSVYAVAESDHAITTPSWDVAN